ncbi:MAG TPA: ABC transporter permease [Firmicutes bacterium]|nr:ABC transporter permease [Bacillota bacterium]
MDLRSFLLRRVFHSIFVVVGISIVIFCIARLVPGDPARMALGEEAPDEVVERLRQEMHLDKPIYEQYYYWLTGVLRGDFGRSLVTHQPVLQDIKETLPATMEIALVAGVIMVVLSIILGSIAAWYRDTVIDGIIRVMAYFGVAIPGFVVATVFILVFGYYWHVLPVLGRLSSNISVPPRVTGLLLVDSLIAGNMVAFKDALLHLLLPASSVAMASTFQAARITRSSMVDNMQRDFVAAERGYGIPERRIALRYLLKPSLIPTVSVLGLSLANIIETSFLVELIFNWPGISRYGMQAILSKDLNAISGVVVIAGLGFAVANVIVDLVVANLDPRIRLGGVKGA